MKTLNCDDVYLRTVFGGTTLAAIDFQDIARATSEDNVLSLVSRRISSRWEQSDSHNPHLAPYFKVAEELSLINGVIFRGVRAVIPTTLRLHALQLGHEGHPGIVKMRQRLRDCVWWPGMSLEIDQHIKNCCACLISDKSACPVTAPLHSLPLPPKPWHTVAIDIKGELHGAVSRWRFLIVAYDMYSKWPEVRAVNNVTSSAVISFLKELFSRWGLPTRIITDNGKQFVSREIETFFVSLGIKHSRTALYHPQSNGAVERFNRYLTDQLRIARVEGRSVDEALFTALSAYRSTKHCTTQRSPSELMCGRSMTMPLDRLIKLVPSKQVSFQEAVQQNVKVTQRRNELNYNRRNMVKWNHIEENQQVRVRENVRSTKYDPMWSNPRQVERKINDSTVCLEDGSVRNSQDLVAVKMPFTTDIKAPKHSTENVAKSEVQESEPVSQVAAKAKEESDTQPPPVRRSERVHRLPSRFDGFELGFKGHH